MNDLVILYGIAFGLIFVGMLACAFMNIGGR